MQIRLIPGKELTPSMAARWAEIQTGNPHLDSPFFAPEFTQAVATVRDDVEVAVLAEDDEIVGFFPFQRRSLSIGKPVGGRLSDLQGVIAAPGVPWNVSDLVRGCRLSAWDFDNLDCTQAPFAAHFRTVEPTAYMDVSQGFEHYRLEQRRSGTTKFKHAGKLARRAERDFGSLRFEADCADPEVLETLLRWKSQQYRRTSVPDVFAYEWTAALLRRLRDNSTENFGTVLSTLHIGERLAAVELGLRWRHVDHSWFPAYDPEFARYSPGILLMVELAKAAPEMGITRIELGRLDQMPYKSSFMSGTRLVARGSVSNILPFHWVREGWHRLHARMKSSRLRKTVQLAGRWTRPLRGWLSLR